MKQLLLVLVSVICICYTTNTYAQSIDEEVQISADKIIIDDKGHEGQTTIEIKNGSIFIDGQKISKIDKDIKIIKKNTTSEKHNFQFDFDKMDSPFSPKGNAYGTLSRKAMLGVRTQDAQPGAKVKEVVKGSAAEKAGLSEGDIIVAVDGKNIETSQDLSKTIAEYDKGDAVKIRIERNGKSDDLMAKLQAPAMDKIPFQALPGTGKFSLPFQKLEEMIAEQGGTYHFPNQTPKIGLEIEESENGLEVMSVRENSAAAKAGIQKGDKVMTIENEKVNSIEDLTGKVMSNKDNKKMIIGVQRNGAIKSLPVVLPRAKRRAQF